VPFGPTLFVETHPQRRHFWFFKFLAASMKLTFNRIDE
jgi:hypothetical protein